MSICRTDEESGALLCARDIAKYYLGEPVIEDVNLSVNAEETVALIGMSGIGKSTLFHILAGILPPDEGRVLLSGEDITCIPGRVGYMLQKDLLMPYKTILQNVSLPLILKGQRKKDAYEKASSYFALFGLSGCEHRYPGTLSGGMRRRAALLRTYLTDSPIILLDEPFSALDSITGEEIWSWYLDVSRRVGFSTLFITHDISEALRYAGRIYVMSGKPGKITAEIRDPAAHTPTDLRAML